MKRFLPVFCLFLCCSAGLAQKGDTVRKYLNEKFQLTDKRNAAHDALAIKENDHWYLTTNYPDTSGVLFKIYFKDKGLTIYDGPRIIYHPHNIKSEEINMRDNIAQGAFRSWYENGSLKDSGDYSNGRKNGLWKSWYQDGQIESTGSYSNSLHEGEWNWYYENGKPSTKEIYVKNKITKLECYNENGEYSGDRCGIAKVPIPVGNFTSLDAYLQENINWTKEMTDMLSSGTWVVKLKFIITKEGDN